MNRALAQEHSDMVSLYRFLFKLPFLLIALLIRFIVRVIVFLWRKLRRNRQPPEVDSNKETAAQIRDQQAKR